MEPCSIDQDNEKIISVHGSTLNKIIVGNDLATYINRLELITFFAGYPFIYALVYFIAGYLPKGTGFINRVVMLLPFAYALSGTLFLGLILKSLYPNHSLSELEILFQPSFIKIWGLMSILFWVRTFSKRTIFSLLHSLVFLFLLLKDLLLNILSSIDKEMLQNDMRMYIISLILITGCLSFITILYFVCTAHKKYQAPVLNR